MCSSTGGWSSLKPPRRDQRGTPHTRAATLRDMPVALEWGPVGARTLAESSDVVVVIDVLSFSTSLTVAVERGAKVWPHTGGESARQLAGTSTPCSRATGRRTRGSPCRPPA